MNRFRITLSTALTIGLLMSGCTESDGPSLLGSGTGGGNTPPGFLSFTNGQAAFVVVGQSNFTSGGVGTTASRFEQLGQTTVGTSGTLWITDSNNTRVLGYNSVPQTNGAAADLVVGQVNFTSNTPGSSSTELANPYSAVDNGTQFFVSDRSNNRIQVFNTIPTGSTPVPDFSIGAPVPGSIGAGVCSQSEFRSPVGMFATASYLYVADPDVIESPFSRSQLRPISLPPFA